MRKGATLETSVNKLLKFLASKGIHGHKNHALRLMDGKTVQGEAFDYEVFSPSVHHVFDAKECMSGSWNLKTNAKVQQINALKQCKNCGCNAFFLVYFVPDNKVIVFDVDSVIQAISVGKKSLTADEGVVFDWQIFLK